jgi:alpha-galactosidase
MVVDEQKESAIVNYYQILSMPNPPTFKVKLTGLDPGKLYIINESGLTVYGDELMYSGIQLPDKRHKGDFQTFTWTLTSK